MKEIKVDDVMKPIQQSKLVSIDAGKTVSDAWKKFKKQSGIIISSSFLLLLLLL